MRILIVTDAWTPQVNGVVFTLNNVINFIRRRHDVMVLHPNAQGAEQLFTFYHDIPFVKNPFYLVRKYFDRFKPDKVHIATEGSLGLAARRHCVGGGVDFNTSYHTRLDDYGVPKFITQKYVKWFHGCSRKVLVTTRSIANRLGLRNCAVWGRGVDTELFNCDGGGRTEARTKTIISVGRVSKDKNLDDFCKIPGYRKILVGDGPYLKTLRAKYPDVLFAGHVPHDELKHWYRKADVFVFPSKFDTFGLVILEAMACGLPVVAYDVPSPNDIVRNGVTGILGNDLQENVARAFDDLDYLSSNALEYAKSQGWQSIAEQFVKHLCE